MKEYAYFNMPRCRASISQSELLAIIDIIMRYDFDDTSRAAGPLYYATRSRRGIRHEMQDTDSALCISARYRLL